MSRPSHREEAEPLTALRPCPRRQAVWLDLEATLDYSGGHEGRVER